MATFQSKIKKQNQNKELRLVWCTKIVTVQTQQGDWLQHSYTLQIVDGMLPVRSDLWFVF